MTISSLIDGFGVDAAVRTFAHSAGGRVEFGVGVIEKLGKFCVDQPGASHVFLVSDPGIVKAGHIERAEKIMRAAGLEVTVFDDVHENPTTEDVRRAVVAAKAGGVDVIVGLGGGSSMDTAKGCNFLLTNGGEMKDYWGVDKAEKPMLPFIAVPTTAGTGSECQSFALIADAETHMKMACGDKKASAAVALLDPELTLTQPRGVTALTGIDAISHAVETAVCEKRTTVSAEYSRIGFRLLNGAFETVLSDPDDLTARGEMQLGAAYAGTAIENSMLGIAHSCANPLSAHFGITHGQAVGVMLPHVIRFNQQDAAVKLAYAELYDGDLAVRAQEWLALAGLKVTLGELGVSRNDLPMLAKEAAEQWTAQFNPVEVDAEALLGVYTAAL